VRPLPTKACTDSEVAGTCRELLKHNAALWTFVYHEGVEPTSNAAERALRHGVLWRRCSASLEPRPTSRFAWLDGRSVLRELAEELGSAYETARVHLKRVFAKTGASRQQDLVRLLTALVPDVDTSSLR